MSTEQPTDARVHVPISLLIAAAALTVSFGAIFGLLADLQKSLGFAAWGLGVAAAGAFIAAFFAQILLARYADRGYGRVMLVGGVALAVVACLGIAAANDLAELIAARALLGVAEGVFFPAARRVVIVQNPHSMGGALGRLTAWQTGGFLCGPPLAAFVADAFGLRVPFVLLAVGLCVTLPVMLRFAVPPITGGDGHAPVRALLANPGVRAGLYLGAGLAIPIGVYDSLWARYLTDLGASTVFIGVSLTLFALPMAVFAGRAGRLAEREGPRRVGMFGLAGAVPFIALYGIVAVPWVIGCIAFVQSFFDSVVVPSSQAQVAHAAPREHIAAGQGLLDGTGLLLSAVTALLAAPVYERWGAAAVWLGLAACVAVCAVVVAPRPIRTRETRSPARALAEPAP
ncbi:MAG TPA: MFS transporter [Acidimicrobiia bacterium]|jgi:predicted MFS family arabinose efflux permease